MSTNLINGIPEEVYREHILVKMLARYEQATESRGMEVKPINLFCYFYAPEKGKLRTAHARVSNHVGQTSLMWLKMDRGAQVTSFYDIDYREEIDRRIEHARNSEKMDILPGAWYIQPETLRIFEIGSIPAEYQRVVGIMDRGMHGLEDRAPESAMGISGSASTITREGRDIADRLGEVNPARYDWFFCDDQV